MTFPARRVIRVSSLTYRAASVARSFPPLSGGVSVAQLDRAWSFELLCCGFKSCQTLHPSAAPPSVASCVTPAA